MDRTAPEEVSQAGGGFFGTDRDCALPSEGTGTFTPLPGSRPFAGEVGKRKTAPEVRLETVYPAHREEVCSRCFSEPPLRGTCIRSL